MKSQVLYSVWCNISGEAAGKFEIDHLLVVKGLMNHERYELSFAITRSDLVL